MFNFLRRVKVLRPARSANNDKFLEALSLVKRGESVSFAIFHTGLTCTNGQLMKLIAERDEQQYGWRYQD